MYNGPIALSSRRSIVCIFGQSSAIGDGNASQEPVVRFVVESDEEIVCGSSFKIRGNVISKIGNIFASHCGNHWRVSIELLAQLLWKERAKLQKDVLDPLGGSGPPIYELAKDGVHKILIYGRDGLVVPKSMYEQKFHKITCGTSKISTLLDCLLQDLGQNFVMATAL